MSLPGSWPFILPTNTNQEQTDKSTNRTTPQYFMREGFPKRRSTNAKGQVVRKSPNPGLKRRETLAGPRLSWRLRRAEGQAFCQPRTCLASLENQPLRAVTRSRARRRRDGFQSGCPSSHRANRNAGTRHQRQPPLGRNQSRIFSPPRHQNAFSPSPSKKRSRVAAPGRTVFNSPRARPLSPALRSELQTDRHWKRRRSRATQFL
jgi:hypothetical protein